MNFLFDFFSSQGHIWKHIAYLFNTFVSLFVMVDPFAAIPIYLILTERYTPVEVVKVRRKATYVATGILILFAISGLSVLKFFGISIASLRIAGGMLLLKFSIEHMSGHPQKINHAEEDESLQRNDISIVPLSMPLLAGPGAISTTVVQSTHATSLLNICLLILAIGLVMWTSYLTLKSSQYLYRWLGQTGLNLLGRIMGIIVAAIAIEFILTGLKDVFPRLWS